MGASPACIAAGRTLMLHRVKLPVQGGQGTGTALLAMLCDTVSLASCKAKPTCKAAHLMAVQYHHARQSVVVQQSQQPAAVLVVQHCREEHNHGRQASFCTRRGTGSSGHISPPQRSAPPWLLPLLSFRCLPPAAHRPPAQCIKPSVGSNRLHGRPALPAGL